MKIDNIKVGIWMTIYPTWDYAKREI